MDVSGSCLIAERQPGGAFTLTPAAAGKNAVAFLSSKEVRARLYHLLKVVLACVFAAEPWVRLWASSVKLTNSVRSTHFSFLTNCTLCLKCAIFPCTCREFFPLLEKLLI